MNSKFKLVKIGGVVSAVAASFIPAVSHAAIDVTDVLAEIGEASTPIVAIGGAVLMVLVGVKVFKWVRQAM